MKKVIAVLALTFFYAAIAMAGDYGSSYGSNSGSSYRSSYGSSYGSSSSSYSDGYGSSRVTVRESGGTNRYSGWRDNSDGYTRVRDYNGNTLRGTIDNDGYGRLRDDRGNTYKVR